MGEIVKGYREGPAWEPSWWERGLVRYACLSYSLWCRNILIDMGVMKKKAKVKK